MRNFLTHFDKAVQLDPLMNYNASIMIFANYYNVIFVPSELTLPKERK